MAEEYEGVLILNLNQNQLPYSEYKSLNVADFALPSALESGVRQIKVQLAASQLQLTPDQLAKVYEPSCI